MSLPEVVLLGFSGNCREAFESAEDQFTIKAILDDNPGLQGMSFEDVPIRPFADIGHFPEAQVLCLIGSEASFHRRKPIVEGLGLPARRFASLIHHSAQVSRFATVGVGSIISAGVVITSNAVIGDHVQVMPGTVIHHDVKIGDYTLVGTNVTIAGGVEIGGSCYVGSASSLKNGVRIGSGVLVGMGSNVIRDVEPCSVVAGNPARVLRYLSRT